MEIKSIEDLPSIFDIPDPPPKKRWGRWVWVKSNNTLEMRRSLRGLGSGRGHTLYYIDLDQMNTSAQCLDWIFQAGFKAWMTPQDRSDLLEAIRERVNPQANLCSGGISKDRV